MPLSEEYLKSVPESQLRDRAYTPFVLARHERESLEDIKRTLKQGKYTTIHDAKESLDFLEHLANRITVAITNEKKENKMTWDLERDLNLIHELFDQLKELIKELEEDHAPKKTEKFNIHLRR